MMNLIAAVLAVFWLAIASPPSETTTATPMAESVSIPKSFERHEVKDRFGRSITYYLRTPLNQTDRLPVVVYIGGSGAESVWVRVNDTAGMNYGAGAIAAVAKGRARLLVVERPGVAFLETAERPGSAMGASNEFRREHTLERWAEANRAALDHALGLPGIDPSRVLVCGHSEGGLVACRVAAVEPRVTHVASAAGGGVTQLFDLMLLARSGEFCGRTPSADCEQRLIDGWKGVLSDPESADKMWLGHANRRWSTFLASSPFEELSRSAAKVYIVQGTEDRAVAPASADVLYAQLLSRGRDVSYARLVGADHSFAVTGKDNPQADGWRSVWADILTWYIGKPTDPSK